MDRGGITGGHDDDDDEFLRLGCQDGPVSYHVIYTFSVDPEENFDPSTHSRSPYCYLVRLRSSSFHFRYLIEVVRLLLVFSRFLVPSRVVSRVLAIRIPAGQLTFIQGLPVPGGFRLYLSLPVAMAKLMVF